MIATHDDATAFDRLREEWNPLLRDSAADSLFLTWEWLSTWWRHLSAGRRLRLVTVRDGATLIAIAPLSVRPRDPWRLVPFCALELLGMGPVGSDYIDVIVRRGREADALSALSVHLAGQDLPVD